MVLVSIKLYSVFLLIMLIVLVIELICDGNWNNVLFVNWRIFVVREGLILINVVILFILEWGLFSILCSFK